MVVALGVAVSCGSPRRPRVAPADPEVNVATLTEAVWRGDLAAEGARVHNGAFIEVGG